MTPARGESHYTPPGISPWRPETPRALVCASTFSRAAQPYGRCSAAFPAATRRAPSGETRGPPRPNEPPHAGGAVPQLVWKDAVSARAGPTRRTLLPTLISDSTDGGEPLRIASHQPLEPETPRAFACARRVGNLNVFPSRADLPSLQRSPPLRAWRIAGESRAGCPASTTPLTRAGQPPGPTSGRPTGGPGGARAETGRAPRGPRRVSHRLGQQWFEPLACPASALRHAPLGTCRASIPVRLGGQGR